MAATIGSWLQLVWGKLFPISIGILFSLVVSFRIVILLFFLFYHPRWRFDFDYFKENNVLPSKICLTCLKFISLRISKYVLIFLDLYVILIFYIFLISYWTFKLEMVITDVLSFVCLSCFFLMCWVRMPIWWKCQEYDI